jgi:hypothetical protein
MGAMRNAYKILVGEPEGKRQCGRFRCRWDNIRKDLKSGDGFCENGNEPMGSTKGGEFLD